MSNPTGKNQYGGGGGGGGKSKKAGPPKVKGLKLSKTAQKPDFSVKAMTRAHGAIKRSNLYKGK